MKQVEVIYSLDFFPHSNVEAIPQDLACQMVNDCMVQWGCPQRIKIDNGLPFANAGNRDIPTLTQLWWMGLGIEVILNPVGSPQHNGTVEGLQGICKRWSSPKLYESIESYQQRINQTNRIQREVFRIRKLGDKTRKELYPELWQNPRTYEPKNFSLQKVYDTLADKVWSRQTTKSGTLNFWSQAIYIGKDFVYHPVTITVDPIEKLWLIRASDGRLLKTSTKTFFNQCQIFKNAGISMNC